MPIAASRRKKLAFISVAIYWPAIFLLTHIPQPKVVYQANLSDKTLHFMVYFILVFLVWGAIRPYSRVTWNKPAVWAILAVMVWYGVMDEWLQGLVGRTADVQDFFADLAGAVASLLLLTVLSFWPSLLTMSAMAVFVFVNSAKSDLSEVLPIASIFLNPTAFVFFTGLTFHCIKTSKIPFFSRISGPMHQLLPVMLPGLLLVVAKVGGYLMGRSVSERDCVLSAIAIVMTVMLAQNGKKMLEISSN